MGAGAGLGRQAMVAGGGKEHGLWRPWHGSGRQGFCRAVVICMTWHVAVAQHMLQVL